MYSTELGIRLNFGKTKEFPGGGGLNPQPLPFGTPLIYLTTHTAHANDKDLCPSGKRTYNPGKQAATDPRLISARRLGSAKLINVRENMVYVTHAVIHWASYKEIIRIDLLAHTDTTNERSVMCFSRINSYSECEIISSRLKYCIQSKDLREMNEKCSLSIKFSSS
jgi:hypothetical protein